MTALRVGIALGDHLLTSDAARRRALVERVERAGLDHVSVGDHVSFNGGQGFDGLVAATSVLTTSDSLEVLVGVYLLGLRHPLLAARSVSTLASLAPGRLVLGAGVGGEDRTEISNSGVDPSTRGRRLDETLAVMRGLEDGEPFSHRGEFFTIESARILPVAEPRVPIVIGGGGAHAIRRTIEYGDGWLGIFCSPRRFASTATAIRDGGGPSDWFGLTMWCGLDPDPVAARDLIARQMSSLYALPFDRFEHVTAAGTPERVAERLAEYVAAGARYLTVVPVASSAEACIDQVAEVAAIVRKGVETPLRR